MHSFNDKARNIDQVSWPSDQNSGGEEHKDTHIGEAPLQDTYLHMYIHIHIFAFNVVKQNHFSLPDVYIYPTKLHCTIIRVKYAGKCVSKGSALFQRKIFSH
jgi:hypothetical protein